MYVNGKTGESRTRKTIFAPSFAIALSSAANFALPAVIFSIFFRRTDFARRNESVAPSVAPGEDDRGARAEPVERAGPEREDRRRHEEDAADRVDERVEDPSERPEARRPSPGSSGAAPARGYRLRNAASFARSALRPGVSDVFSASRATAPWISESDG